MAKEPWKSKGSGEAAAQPLTPAESPVAAAPPAATGAEAPVPPTAVQTPAQAPDPPVPPASKLDGPKMLRLYRDTPMFPGGPTEADVPESEVASWISVGEWKIKE